MTKPYGDYRCNTVVSPEHTICVNFGLWNTALSQNIAKRPLEHDKMRGSFVNSFQDVSTASGLLAYNKQAKWNSYERMYNYIPPLRQWIKSQRPSKLPAKTGRRKTANNNASPRRPRRCLSARAKCNRCGAVEHELPRWETAQSSVRVGQLKRQPARSASFDDWCRRRRRRWWRRLQG